MKNHEFSLKIMISGFLGVSSWQLPGCKLPLLTARCSCKLKTAN